MKQPLDRIATILALGALALGLAGPGGVRAAAEEPFAAARQRMIQMIERHAREAPEALGSERIDPEVLAVMAEVPRHEFVPEDQREYAYDDRPLPIGYGQTISQPFIVALMTDMAEVGPDDVVLEVGTGSGYQAAVLAKLVDEVHTIEIVPGLAETAGERLERQGFANVETYQGDGYYGIEEEAPFDAIVVTAAASHVPPPLIAQLKPGGRMIIPVGGGFSLQHLMLIEKDADGRVHSRQTLPVAFVPLTRGS
ncbi:MAG TPA: protein-L-isoaspartate(D-aspartate) O-methyltransferase [Geminicoccaceae bacterium]|nr:protein-L-isoaspartate(D-aspartate) O-methyltransferase [Geminicoccaceae bacterium]